ncbi:hypothetical protein [Caballeronia sp. GaOx3]|uniref:hypothetical protein n=1 Tax=Caballeronia sp. GaOx3 TaxID=2921740 RepID=UPI0039182CD5
MDLVFLSDDEISRVDKTSSRHAEIDDPNQDVLARETDVRASSIDGKAFGIRIVE